MKFAAYGAHLFVFIVACSPAVFEGPIPLAGTPPMGWNSWNHFADHVTESGYPHRCCLQHDDQWLPQDARRP